MITLNEADKALKALYLMEVTKAMYPSPYDNSIMNEISKNSKPKLPTYNLPPKPYAGTGRNAPCPCGSGKKYKRCCGR